MARIVICVPPLFGPINSTRKVVNDLRRNGHVVYFVGVPDCEDILADNYFVPVFSKFYPPSKRSVTARKSAAPKQMSLVDKIRGAKSACAVDRALISRLVSGHNEGFETVIGSVNPDIVLIASHMLFAVVWALLAHRFNIPTIYLNSTLTVSENAMVPPVKSHVQPSNGIVGQVRTWLIWKVHNTKKWIIRLRPRLLANTDYPDLIRRLSEAVKFPVELLCEHESTVLTLAPELVLMPEVFDFPHPAWPHRYYCSASVDLLRAECAFPWERLDPTLPVIYCALGTLPHMPQKQYVKFYRCVIEAFMAFCEQYQLVVAVDRNIDPAVIDKNLRNVTVVQHAPQIALLKRSALAITHGGANTVKECITLGVPMLLYPLAVDQFGISARAVFHGIALRGDVAKIRAVEMRAMILKLLKVPYYRMQVRRMQYEFCRAEESRPASQLIEMFLSHLQEMNVTHL
jgi:zeaxanthin glucosyltransferase